jgi:glycosyltransferase involved in cell wall biosynthesis
MQKILEVADRGGWAIDRLAKPISEAYENVDLCYFYSDPSRFLATGYTSTNDIKKFDENVAKDYDIVHFHRAESARMVVGRLRKMNPNIRLICSIHTERDEKQEWEIFDDIICPTKFVYDRMLKLHSRCHFVPTGIDLNKFKYQFAEKPYDNAVGYVGRVMKHKRFDVIAKAIAEANMRLIGCGYIEDSALFGQNFRRNKDDFVLMLPEKQLPGLYSKMKMYVCLSEPNIETGPLPVLEAMACGVPVISTRVGWANDWATHLENIWFIEQEEINMLSKFLHNLCQREDILQKLRDNALRLVSDFGLDTYTKKMMQIYEQK